MMLDSLAAAASAVLVSVGSVIGVRSGTEEPRFAVVAQVGEVEIRRYGARLAAAVTVKGEADAARGEGFKRLAGYIFGANEGGQKIAMTAPVAQSPGERIAMTAPVASVAGPAGWTIRFFMPADRTLATLPAPRDAGVTIVEVPAATVAVLRFSGVPSETRVATQRAALLGALGGGKWQPTGAVEGWFYDPPWTLPPLRRNEVAVPVAG